MEKQFNQKIIYDRHKSTKNIHAEFAPSLILHKTVYVETKQKKTAEKSLYY